MNKIKPLVTAISALVAQCAIAQVTVDQSNHYFNFQGNPVFLLGHYDWASIDPNSRIDHPSTYTKMIDDAAAYDLNYIRVSLSGLRFTQTSVPPIDSSSLTTETTSFVIYDQNGKADLDQWNETYWDALADLAQYAKDNGVILHVPFFDGVTLRQGNQAYRWVNSVWNIDNQVRDFFGDIDTFGSNENSNVDQWNEFYRAADFNNSSSTGTDPEQLGYYQKRFIDKVISTLAPYDNVFFEVGNELFGSGKSWSSAVVQYVKTQTNRVISVNPGNVSRAPNNTDGYSQHTFINTYLDQNGFVLPAVTQDSDLYAEAVKTTLESLSGNNFPIWLDPDEPDLMDSGLVDSNRKAAWISLVSGAAGWGGFTNSYWDNSNTGVIAILEDYQILQAFLTDTQLPLGTMTPDPSLVINNPSVGVLAETDSTYLAYVPEGDNSVTISLGAGNYSCSTLNPKVNDSLTTFDSNCSGEVTAPKPQGSDDWVFYATKNYIAIGLEGSFSWHSETTSPNNKDEALINFTAIELSDGRFEVTATVDLGGGDTDNDYIDTPWIQLGSQRLPIFDGDIGGSPVTQKVPYTTTLVFDAPTSGDTWTMGYDNYIDTSWLQFTDKGEESFTVEIE